MRKKIAIIASFTELLVCSCNNADYRHEISVDGIKGRLFVEKKGTAIALTDDQDALDYEIGSAKKRIFTGTGENRLTVNFDKSRDLLIISYCGGRIERVESSFSDEVSTDGTGWKIYRTQIINNVGFQYRGQAICA